MTDNDDEEKDPWPDDAPDQQGHNSEDDVAIPDHTDAIAREHRDSIRRGAVANNSGDIGQARERIRELIDPYRDRDDLTSEEAAKIRAWRSALSVIGGEDRDGGELEHESNEEQSRYKLDLSYNSKRGTARLHVFDLSEPPDGSGPIETCEVGEDLDRWEMRRAWGEFFDLYD